MRTRTVVAAAILAVAAGAGTVVAVRDRGDGSGSRRPAATGLPTVPVVRGDLTATLQLPGQLGYLATVGLVGHRTGTVTALPAPGTVIGRGATAYAVDQRPVPLLFGDLPAYRPLRTGTTGADVRQLEQNLVALGHGRGVTVDDRYTAATADAVRRWQRALDVAVTGAVEAGDWVAAPGAVRVAASTPLVGQPAAPGGVVVTGTGTEPVVRVPVPLAHRRYVEAGAGVRVRLPDGREVAGRVAVIGTAATPQPTADRGGTAAQSGSQTSSPCRDAGCPEGVPVDIALSEAPTAVVEGSASVLFSAQTRQGVLSVPVEALIPDGDDGYAVVVVDPTGRRAVPVRTGLFTAGRVEVSGDGVTEGARVEVPAA